MSALAVEPRLTAAEWAAMLRNPTLDHRYQLTRLGPAVIDYLAWKKLSRAAEATLDDYERTLARLCMTLPASELRDVTTGDLILVLNLFKPGSWRRARAAINGLFTWAVKSGRIDRNPCDLLPEMRPDPPPVYPIFTSGEQAALLNATRETHLPLVDRVRLGVLSFGARKSGCLGVRVSDINLTDRFILLREKGSKSRLVPIRGAFIQHVDEFLMTPLPLIDRKPAPTDFVFFPAGATGDHTCSSRCRHKATHGTRRGQLLWVDPTRALSKTGYQRWWEQLVGRAGIPYRKGHMMRHTYATDALDATDGDLIGVRDMLGHTSTKTTEVYIHSQRHRLDRAADKLASYRKDGAE